MDQLQLFGEHPLIQEAYSFMTLNLTPGIEDPFSLFKKLKDLANEPLSPDFQAEKILVGEQTVSINLNQLAALQQMGEVKREDLPKVISGESESTFRLAGEAPGGICANFHAIMKSRPLQLSRLVR